eukprot:247316_1
MNHSINNLLWITLFAVLYISSVIEGDPPGDITNNCGVPNHANSCSHCRSTDACEDSTNLGPNGCGCLWVVAGCITVSTCDPPEENNCAGFSAITGVGCLSVPTCDPPEENNCAKSDHANSCNDCLDKSDHANSCNDCLD